MIIVFGCKEAEIISALKLLYTFLFLEDKATLKK